MNSTIRNLLLIAGGILLIFLFWYFRSIVIYILVAGVLSIMGRPLVDLFCRIRIRKWAFPRPISALLTLAIIWTLVIVFLKTFIPLISQQISYFSSFDSEKLVALIQGPIDMIENLFRSLNRNPDANLSLRTFLMDKVSEVLSITVIQKYIGSAVGVAGSMIVAVFSITFITFFFLKDHRLFFETILIWVPDKYVENVTRALNSIKNLLTRYFIGIVIQSTCIMILITIGMTIAGIDFQQALVMGLMLGILNVIPYVGPWLGLFIAIIMGVASHMNQDFNTVVTPLVINMIIVEAVTHTIDNVIFQPIIFSNSVKAHPLEIFIVVLAAGFAAGVPGMILGIPAYTVIRVLAREFFYNFKVVQKVTSSLEETPAGTHFHAPSVKSVKRKISGRIVEADE
ncbi:MAG TPA: AI-2E family transporter [Bacteroidales bacterium]|jgi:predicted PurR-regulated permease PerM|nr:AI-2E family transporter [Bacteroidales bacterium]